MGEMSYTSHYATVNGLRYHYITAGPEDGPLVFLLHGFPEFWYGWRHQIAALSAAGFRVVAPDQRGYNQTDKPRGVKQYDIELLAKDVLGLMDSLGAEQVYLAGHDWGAEVAWWVAAIYPERVRKMAILNVPHPFVMRENVFSNRAQRRKSWYIFFFQLPFIPELILGNRNQRGAARILQSSGNPGSFTSEDIARYKQAWSQPRAWTGMIHWYRAVMRRAVRPLPRFQIEPPTLIIWGEQDGALEASMAAESLAFCKQGQLKALPEATHWVQHDAKEKVNRYLIEFFSQ
jgi:pimeloyl-ACP methyl ester carboxylesterase